MDDEAPFRLSRLKTLPWSYVLAANCIAFTTGIALMRCLDRQRLFDAILVCAMSAGAWMVACDRSDHT